ncbi:hypothetical protein HNP40_003407 [Mycobacteroides chelonae]|nr:hypothetical protein [Mycobacteroides chelonae]
MTSALFPDESDGKQGAGLATIEAGRARGSVTYHLVKPI